MLIKKCILIKSSLTLLLIREFSKHTHTKLFYWILATYILWKCAGGESHVVRWWFCTFFLKRTIQNQDEASATKFDVRLIPYFTWPAIFAASIKTQLCGYIVGKDKNPAIWLTLLLLVLLSRKLSTILSPTYF